jgi:DinB superfamily
VDWRDLILVRYDWLRQRLDRFDDQSDEQWRARPHGLNSIAWLVWHVARCEDGGLNRLVSNRPQVLDDATASWPERMRVTLRHHGTRMTSGEVDELTANVDILALRAYSGAVAESTREVVRTLPTEVLDDVVEPAHLRTVLFDEGLIRPGSDWPDPPPYSGAQKGDLLMHFGLTHSFSHFHDISTVGGFLGLPT